MQLKTVFFQMCNNILQQKIILRRRKRFCVFRALAKGLNELQLNNKLCHGNFLVNGTNLFARTVPQIL